MREEGPAGDGSLLPEAAEEYVEAAATTVEDVETFAPVVLIRSAARSRKPTPRSMTTSLTGSTRTASAPA